MTKKITLSLLASLVMTSFTLPVLANETTPAPVKSAKPVAAKQYSEAEINALMDQLVKSGKLDAAVDAGIQRYTDNQRAQAMKQKQVEQQKQAEMAKAARKVNPARDHIYGNVKAEWSFIVYSDLECPFCKAHSGIPEEAVKIVGTDKVNVVFRHLPLPMHGEVAKKEAIATECFSKQAPDQFFKFVNDIFKHTQLNGQGLKEGDAELLRLAKSNGLKDEAAYQACLKDPKVADLIKEDMDDGAKAGVTGTPGNILRNNKTGQSIPAHGYNRGGEKAIADFIKNYVN